MKQDNQKYMLGIVVLFFMIGFVNAESFGYGRTEDLPINYSNIIINETSNQTEYWNTDEGTLGTVNATQFNNNGGTLNIIETWVNSKWCELVGCTMTGDLTLPNLIATGIITATGGNSTEWNLGYDHSQNNTQAHSDYLLNTGDTGIGEYIFDGKFELKNAGTPVFTFDPAVGIGHFGYGATPLSFWFTRYFATTDSNYPNTLARFDIEGTGSTGITAMAGQATMKGTGFARGMSFRVQYDNATNSGDAMIGTYVENAYKYTEDVIHSIGSSINLDLIHVIRGNWITGSTVLNVDEMIGIRSQGFNINYADGDATINIATVVGIQIEDSILTTGTTNPTITDQIGINIQSLTSATNNYGIVMADNIQTVYGTGKDAEIYGDGTNLIFNTNATGSGDAWFSRNVSATGFITRTTVWNENQSGRSIDNFKSENQLKNLDGSINHSAYGSCYAKTPVTDFSRPELENYTTCQEREVYENYTKQKCSYESNGQGYDYVCVDVIDQRIKQNCTNETRYKYVWSENLGYYEQESYQVEICQDIIEEVCTEQNKTIYPHTKIEDGVSMDCLYAKTEDAFSTYRSATDIITYGNNSKALTGDIAMFNEYTTNTTRDTQTINRIITLRDYITNMSFNELVGATLNDNGRLSDIVINYLNLKSVSGLGSYNLEKASHYSTAMNLFLAWENLQQQKEIDQLKLDVADLKQFACSNGGIEFC